MIGEIEQIHRARNIEVAIGIVLTGELRRVIIEIRLHFEIDPERIARLALRIRTLAAETQRPLLRRAIRDHAELAREAHASYGKRVGPVVAVLPVRIATDDFAL